MTLIVAVKALAHGVPIFLAYAWTNSRVVVTVVAVLAGFVAVKIGGDQYAVLDLLVVVVVYYLCISNIASAKKTDVDKTPAPEPLRLPSQPKQGGGAAAFIGLLSFVGVCVILYNKFADKPVPVTPSLADRLERFATEVRSRSYDKNFPLTGATVDGDVLFLSFRSTDLTAARVSKKYAQTHFGEKYAAYYCASQAARPLLNSGAKIIVKLDGRDSKAVGAYSVSKRDCDALNIPTPV